MAATVASTRSPRDFAAVKDPPRKAARVSPEPSKKPGPMRVTATPSAASRSKIVGCGCHCSGVGPSSQVNSLKTTSRPGSRTS